MAWIRKLIYLLGVLVLFVAMPLEARADPISIAILAAIGINAAAGSTAVAITTAILVTAVSTAASLGIGAIYNALHPPKPINSPRPDIAATTSRYGEPIPRIYRRFAVGGKIIYAGSVTDNTTTEQIGSGKRKQVVNGHYNSQSFGVLVCENIDDTVLGVTKIWLNDNLVYNVNDYGSFGELDLDGTDQMILMHSSVEYPSNEAYPNNLGLYNSNPSNTQSYVGKARNFRVALGRSDQTTSLVADWYYSDYGGSIPAYRGYVTLWWNDMDLRDYYNRIPTVMVEVLTSHEFLSDVVSAECQLAGIDSGDLSLTELEDIPAPRTFNDTASPKGFFEALAWYRRFTLVNIDGAVTGLLLPRDPSNAPDGSSSVSNGLLGTRQGGIEEGGEQPPKFTYREEQIGELPKKLNFTYYDIGNNYEEASYPYIYPIGDASASAQVFPPIALDGDTEAIPLASAAMATTYSERGASHFTLPPSFAQYHPGDVLTIPAPNNQLVDCRIQKMSFIPGQMVEVDTIRQIRKSNVGLSTEDNPDNLPADVPGDPGGGPDAIAPTVWVLSNVPPLYDDHEMFAGVYGAAAPSTETGVGSQWTGATFVRNACGSDDTNQEYQYVGHTDTPALIGRAITALASATGTDTTNTVDIEFPYGVNTGLETIHNDAWVNTTTANLAILGKEVLQFKTITDLVTDPPSYRLSNLKRGLRDTEAYVGTHAITNEVQTLTFGGTITGGTFTLTFNSQTTGAIAWSSTNSTLVSNIDTALGALSSIGGAGNVTTAVGTMTAGIGTITVTFVNDLGARDVPLMTRASSLTGTAPTLEVSLTTQGSGDTFVLVTPLSVIRLPVNLNEHSTNGSTPIFNWKCYTDGEVDTEVNPIPFVVYEAGNTSLTDNDL